MSGVEDPTPRPTSAPDMLHLPMTDEFKPKLCLAVWGVFPGPSQDKYNAEIEACRVARLARAEKAKAENVAKLDADVHYSKRGAIKLKNIPQEDLVGQTFANTLVVIGAGRTAKAVFGWTVRCGVCKWQATRATGEIKRFGECPECRLRRTRTSDATNGKEEPSHGSKEESREQEARSQEDRESGSEEVGEENVG